MQSMANILTTALKVKCQEVPGKINIISICVLERLLPVFSENGMFGLVCYCQSVFGIASIVISVLCQYNLSEPFKISK